MPQFATVNGVRLAYERAGTGLPTLLIHGFPRDRRLWRKIVPLVVGDLETVAYDRRGYGESDRGSDPSLHDSLGHATDALALADSLGWKRFLVVGHDMGQPVAQRLAADFPDRVAGGVFLDSLPQGTPYSPPPDVSGRTWYFDFFRQRNVAEQIVGQNPRLFFSLFLQRNPHLTPEEHEMFLEPFSRPGSMEAVLADYRHMLEDDRERWRAWVGSGNTIRVPVCVLWANRGPVGAAPVLDLWRQVAPNVRGQALENTAHYIQEEQPEAVAQHICAFARESGLV